MCVMSYHIHVDSCFQTRVLYASGVLPGAQVLLCIAGRACIMLQAELQYTSLAMSRVHKMGLSVALYEKRCIYPTPAAPGAAAGRANPLRDAEGRSQQPAHESCMS